MPVTAEHTDYLARIKQWKRCRNAVAGEDAIKAAGTAYLPRLGGHTDDEYDAYKARSVWYNATSRTVDGLTGLIFRKPPSITTPAGAEPLLEDVTTDGLSIQEFAEAITEEAIIVGRGGILVDYPHVEVTDDATQADIESRGDRPYLAHYVAEAITNWRTGRVDNRTVLTMVVLKEQYSEAKDDFEVSSKDQYRVLRLDGGTYSQQIWRKFKTEDDREERWRLAGEATPLMNGAPLNFIPFYFVGPRDASPTVAKPPILDLATMNVSHYRTMADLENGRHWTGVPTPVFIGKFVTEDGEDVTEVQLGSTEGIHLEDGGDAKFLEFTGAGLASLENGAKAKEEYMAVLGARILAQEKRMAEAAETANIHRAGESSILASIANAVSKVLTRAVQTLVAWSSGSEDGVAIELNTDFVPTEMSPQMLQAMLAAWQQGAMSFEDLVDQMKKGELLRSDRTADDIRQDREDEPPTSGGLPGGSADGGGLFG